MSDHDEMNRRIRAAAGRGPAPTRTPPAPPEPPPASAFDGGARQNPPAAPTPPESAIRAGIDLWRRGRGSTFDVDDFTR